jgi:hypothetical protein
VTLAEIYLKAAEVIRTNGHYKGAYFGLTEGCVGIELSANERPVCVAGALSVVIYGHPQPWEDSDFDKAAADFASRTLTTFDEGNPVASLADWNDSDRRTADDVIAALEQAAKAVA